MPILTKSRQLIDQPMILVTLSEVLSCCLLDERTLCSWPSETVILRSFHFLSSDHATLMVPSVLAVLVVRTRQSTQPCMRPV